MKTLEFRDGALWLLDQTRLPVHVEVLECRDYSEVAEAITHLRVRGAPFIGVSAAYALVLAADSLARSGHRSGPLLSALQNAAEELHATRPTAVNLAWALKRMWSVVEAVGSESPDRLVLALRAEADAILREDEEASRRMARLGADLIPEGAQILTHCNTGALVAGAFGTALGAIREAHDRGKRIHVWVDETRPLLQGARLTAWELQQSGVPHTLITDNMAGHFMHRGQVDLVMVGADRIVANGDAANKIGTYSVATLAKAHGIPFYFVAPTSTVDLSTPSGDLITIEERSPAEVTTFRGVQVAPEGTHAANPAFDVTPARLISAIVTDRGVIRQPFADDLRRVASVPHPPVEPIETALVGTDGT
jgi:methylthioribose-1-phosphate isomerase